MFNLIGQINFLLYVKIFLVFYCEIKYDWSGETCIDGCRRN
jgi:hypothetical protein